MVSTQEQADVIVGVLDRDEVLRLAAPAHVTRGVGAPVQEVAALHEDGPATKGERRAAVEHVERWGRQARIAVCWLMSRLRHCSR